MKYEHFWMMLAAAGATTATIGGAATAALAHQQRPSTTIIGEREIDENQRTVKVSYRDLNLAAPHDELILLRRVKSAGRSVCAPNDDRLTNRPFSTCVSGARASALPQVDLAVKRAREIAQNGTSSIPLVAIAVVGVR